MAPPRLKQFLADRNLEHNRGAFSEITELDEENINSEMLSKPSIDPNNLHDLSNEDLSHYNPTTPKSFDENSPYDLEEYYPSSSKVLKVPHPQSVQFKKPDKSHRNEIRVDTDNSNKVTTMSENALTEEAESDHLLTGPPRSGKHISFNHRSKPAHPLTDRSSRPKPRSKSKPLPNSSVVSNIFQNRPSKDNVFPKQQSARTPHPHFETITNIKKNPRDNKNSSRTNSHSANQRKRITTESNLDFKVDERLKEFKMLKESFLKSLFSKSREENTKHGLRRRSNSKVKGNTSFEEGVRASRENNPSVHFDKRLIG
jgi:hypothetical protein